jgi:hypothetical protein
MKAIKQAQTRDILDAYDRGDISYSRMNEMFNELADKFTIGFAKWSIKWRVEFVDDTQEGVLYTYGGLCQKFTMKQLLEIYKKDNE